MFRRTNEIKAWIAKHHVWGTILNHNVTIKKLKKIDKRLNYAFAIPGTAMYFVPLITRGKERAEMASKTTEVNKRRVPKTRVLLLYMQDICGGHRFYQWNRKDIADEIKRVLKNGTQNAQQYEEYEDLTIGVDFETMIYDQLRYQTFLINKSGTVEDNGKIRIAMCFEKVSKKNKAKKILKDAADKDKWKYPWKIYEMKPKKHYTYFDTDIFSMMIHWLTDMNLDVVVCAGYLC